MCIYQACVTWLYPPVLVGPRLKYLLTPLRTSRFLRLKKLFCSCKIKGGWKVLCRRLKSCPTKERFCLCGSRKLWSWHLHASQPVVGLPDRGHSSPIFAGLAPLSTRIYLDYLGDVFLNSQLVYPKPQPCMWYVDMQMPLIPQVLLQITSVFAQST